MRRCIVAVLLGLGLLLTTSLAAAGEESPQLTEEQKRLNVESFDVVWQTINDLHFDTTFGGLDWAAVRDELRPDVENAATMRDAREVMRAMLGRLGLSHFGIIPGDVYENIDKPVERGDRGGNSGIRVRVLDGHAVVTYVIPDSPADHAGVRVGWEILDINGENIPELLPPIQEDMAGSRRLPIYLASAAATRLIGNVGDTVEVTFLDGHDEQVTCHLELAEPVGKKAVFGNLPPFYLRTETRTLNEGIGYFAFNCFFDPPALMPAFNDAMRSFMKAPGIIIDLRGNPGGIAALGMGMAGWFVGDKGVYIGTLSTRETELRLVINPRPKPFAGPVAVLIDGLSGSSSEFFAGGLKDIGRARIFGTNSIGAALPSTIEILPNGDRFQYVLGNYVLASGAPLEGRGVAPDQLIELDRASLLQGDDPVIDAAIEWILTRHEN